MNTFFRVYDNLVKSRIGRIAGTCERCLFACKDGFAPAVFYFWPQADETGIPVSQLPSDGCSHHHSFPQYTLR